MVLSELIDQTRACVAKNSHGHVIPNPDGLRARCGGPALCPDCKLHENILTLIKIVEQSHDDLNVAVEPFSSPPE